MSELRMTLAEPASAPAIVRARNSNGGSLYEGGSVTRRTAGWRAPTTSANQAVLASLATLRDRSRAAVRNDGYAKSVSDKLVVNVCGTGIKPLSRASLDLPQVPHPVTRQLVPFRVAIQALWLLWTDEADADGQLDWYGLQSQAVRTWFEGGESFARMRNRLPGDGLRVPFQVQVLEPELCPHTYNVFAATGKIRAGIEFDPIGRRVAYWFHPTRPEYDDYDASVLRRVTSDTVVHLFDPLRPGQLRGIPHLTQALISLYELDKYDDATLLRQQLANMFVAFLKRSPTIGDAQAFHPLTGQTVETSTDDKAMLGLEPGIFQELDPGEDVTFSDPPDANGYPDFMRQQLLGVAAATGVPYEVITGDMRGVNDRTVRLILNEFRRRIQMMQHHVVVFQFCRPIWRAWMDRVFLSGALPIPVAYLEDPEPWLAADWKPQGWPYMHPVQDVDAKKAAIRAGLTSRSAEVSESGEDAEVIDAEQQADNDRADALGLKYDSDGRNQATAASAPPQPEPDPQPAGAPA